MPSVGTRLREARIKHGYTLDDINLRTRISLKNLNAIESDDLSNISSPFTYRSFVRQFADLVGLDRGSLELDVQAAASTMAEPLVPGQEEELFVRPHKVVPKQPRIESLWTSYRTISVVVVVCLVSGYFIWRSAGTPSSKQPSTSVPAADHAAKPRGAESSDPNHVSTGQTSQPAAPSTDKTKSSVAAPSGASTEPPPGASASAAPKVGPPVDNAPPKNPTPTPVAPRENAAIHIELSAMEPTWLLVASDGKTKFNGVLPAMQTKVFYGKEKARIRTHNAGAVNVVFNGRALGALGRRGQTRTFVFTKSGYEVVHSARAYLASANQSGE